MNKIKMYIMAKEDVPVGKAITSVAHASLAAYLKWKDDPEVISWVEGIFYKVVCKVSNKNFEDLKSVDDHIVMTESSMDNQEIVIVFKPRADYPELFKFFKLYK